MTNTGGKKISAIFIDVSSALYPDSVFDPDGLGGDAAAKDWQINTAGDTGAFISGGTDGYFLPGVDPIANSGESGGASNGGYKGAMVKFNANNNSGGFQNGEVVGFSGDMDPNSIAGMTKSGPIGVDIGAIQGWDVGGISGHELIGSLFTVLFDDGTTASGQLGSDKSNAGSVAVASQALTPKSVSLVRQRDQPGRHRHLWRHAAQRRRLRRVPATWSGSRSARASTRSPTTRTASPIWWRRGSTATTSRSTTPSTNRAWIVTIGANGTFDASGLFDYDDANGTGKGGFTGDDVAQIAFVASVMTYIGGSELAPAGPVTAPIYLTNQGGPVTGDPVDPPVLPGTAISRSTDRGTTRSSRSRSRMPTASTAARTRAANGTSWTRRTNWATRMASKGRAIISSGPKPARASTMRSAGTSCWNTPSSCRKTSWEPILSASIVSRDNRIDPNPAA